MREPNPDKLNELVGKLVNDLGASLAGASILLGDRLGLYRTLAEVGPATSHELAEQTGTHERYIREWLAAHLRAQGRSAVRLGQHGHATTPLYSSELRRRHRRHIAAPAGERHHCVPRRVDGLRLR